ncbi:hypothetical protein ACHAWF_003679 [Thalassiosira exigua]
MRTTKTAMRANKAAQAHAKHRTTQTAKRARKAAKNTKAVSSGASVNGHATSARAKRKKNAPGDGSASASYSRAALAGASDGRATSATTKPKNKAEQGQPEGPRDGHVASAGATWAEKAATEKGSEATTKTYPEKDATERQRVGGSTAVSKAAEMRRDMGANEKGDKAATKEREREGGSNAVGKAGATWAEKARMIAAMSPKRRKKLQIRLRLVHGPHPIVRDAKEKQASHGRDRGRKLIPASSNDKGVESDAEEEEKERYEEETDKSPAGEKAATSNPAANKAASKKGGEAAAKKPAAKKPSEKKKATAVAKKPAAKRATAGDGSKKQKACKHAAESNGSGSTKGSRPNQLAKSSMKSSLNLKRDSDQEIDKEFKNRRKMLQAAKDFKEGRHKAAGLSKHQFLLRRQIPTRTFNRFLKNNCVFKPLGRPWKCDVLLKKCNLKVDCQQKLETTDIFTVLSKWNKMNNNEHKNDKRKSRELFVCAPDIESPEGWFGMETDATKLKQYKLVHIIALLGKKHYCYIQVSRVMGLKYFDSGRSSARLKKRTGPNEHMLQIERGFDGICKLDNGYFVRNDDQPLVMKNVEKNLPVQPDSCSCGVFSLFYVDCVKNGFEIKTKLTEEELSNYRGALSELMRCTSKGKGRK